MVGFVSKILNRRRVCIVIMSVISVLFFAAMIVTVLSSSGLVAR